jgi:hypothetical protein
MGLGRFFLRMFVVRFTAIITGAVAVMGLVATSAFATSGNDLARICDSARLTATERKECAAQFKAASSAEARLAVYQTFDERINGAAAGQ